MYLLRILVIIYLLLLLNFVFFILRIASFSMLILLSYQWSINGFKITKGQTKEQTNKQIFSNKNNMGKLFLINFYTMTVSVN